MDLEEIRDMAGTTIEKSDIKKIKDLREEELAERILVLMHYAYIKNLDLEDILINKIEEINGNNNYQ